MGAWQLNAPSGRDGVGHNMNLHPFFKQVKCCALRRGRNTDYINVRRWTDTQINRCNNNVNVLINHNIALVILHIKTNILQMVIKRILCIRCCYLTAIQAWASMPHSIACLGLPRACSSFSTSSVIIVNDVLVWAFRPSAPSSGTVGPKPLGYCSVNTWGMPRIRLACEERHGEMHSI